MAQKSASDHDFILVTSLAAIVLVVAAVAKVVM